MSKQYEKRVPEPRPNSPYPLGYNPKPPEVAKTMTPDEFVQDIHATIAEVEMSPIGDIQTDVSDLEPAVFEDIQLECRSFIGTPRPPTQQMLDDSRVDPDTAIHIQKQLGMPQVSTLKEQPPKQRSILHEADAIAGEDRSRDYGHPLENHKRIAAMWNVRLQDHLKTPLTPQLVAELMILLKVARMMNTRTRDCLVDIAGYVKCIDMMDEAIARANNGV